MSLTITINGVGLGGELQSVSALDGEIPLGRELENKFVVDNENVSRNHAIVERVGSQWIFVDLGSSNGSWLNGVVCEEGVKKILRDRDEIHLADYRCTVSLKGDEVDSSPSLLVFEDDSFSLEFPLAVSRASFTIGASEDSDLSIAKLGDTRVEISAKESSLELETAGIPVIVNRSSVTGSVRLVDRDEVILDSATILVSDPRESIAKRKAAIEATSSGVWTPGVEGSESKAGDSLAMTQRMPAYSSGKSAPGRYEVSASHRFAAARAAEQEQQGQAFEFVKVIIGAVTFFAIIGLLVYFLFF